MPEPWACPRCSIDPASTTCSHSKRKAEQSRSSFRSATMLPSSNFRGARSTSTPPKIGKRFYKAKLRFAAEEFSEGLKEFVRDLGSFLAEVAELLRELHLVAAVNFARGSRNFVLRQIDFVSRTGCFAPGCRKMIGLRTYERVNQRYGRLEILGRITFGAFVHHLNPDR